MAITRTQIARQLLQFGGGADASKSDFGGDDRNKDRDRRDDRPNMRDIAGLVRPVTNPVFGDPDPEVDVPTRLRKDTGTSFLKNLNAERRANPFLTGAALINPIFGIPTLFKVAKQTGDMRKALGVQSPKPVDFSGMDRGGDVPLWAQLGFSSEAEYLAALARTQASSDMDQETEEEDEGLRLAFRANGGRIGFQGGGKDLGAGASGMGSGGKDRTRDRDGDPRDRRRVEQYTRPPKPTGGGGGNGGGIIPDTPSRFKKNIFDTSPLVGINTKNLINFDLLNDEEQDNMQMAKVYGAPELTEFGATPGMFKDTAKFNDMEKYQEIANKQFKMGKEPSAIRDSIKIGSSLYGIDMDNIPKDFLETKEDFKNQKILGDIEFAHGGRAGLAEGGMPYEGGIMDLESARQMYGLGKLVKKVTRTVKKIAKSPVGKAAILAAGGYYLGGGNLFGLQRAGMSGFSLGNLPGASFFGKGSFNPLKALSVGKDVMQSPFGKIISGIPGGITTAIAGTSLLAGLLTPEQEKEAEQLSRGEGIDIEAARRMILQAGTSGDQRGLAFRAEGGPAEGKEPVAKKTMPLLDMGGKEMDLREDGGFVPIGRMEKADDVPARLSKNEFVFTADAVRNAGDGDVDKGAEVMYNMMKNLESGGDVSEESQGLEGARKMFQTSQRLEEVL